jgi:pimeloyl-ACP methyl ester carboxylesterase
MPAARPEVPEYEVASCTSEGHQPRLDLAHDFGGAGREPEEAARLGELHRKVADPPAADCTAVIAPANPMRRLKSDSDYIASVLRAIDGPIVLVGHAYAGSVITNAAAGNPNVKALVYVAAFAPEPGEEPWGSSPGSPAARSRRPARFR